MLPPEGGEVVVRPTNREFLPSRHGFAFRNSFTGSPIPRSIRETAAGTFVERLARRAADVPERFGLCGGMSAAAADFFLARVPIPPDQEPPAPDSPLYDYLQQRQQESLGDLAVLSLKFMQWMQLPDLSETGPSTGGLSSAELGAIRERLDAGELLPIGLVYVRAGEGRPWDNHQVLAYGVEAGEAGEVRVRVYDPNAPGDDAAVIVVKPAAAQADGSAQVTAVQRFGSKRERVVRGFFAMPYARREPPRDGPG